MDDQSRTRPTGEKGEGAEGVRIIGPDEAAEAIERGGVAPRRSDDELRYGDRPPPPPAGPRPALRFPLDASADPTRIERPPVQPPPDPVTGPVALPHWTEPPTGEVPAVLVGNEQPLIQEDEDDLDAWSSFATTTPRWRDGDEDWGDDDFVQRLAGDRDEPRLGALGDNDDEPSQEEYFGFDDMAKRVEERTRDAPEAAAGPDDGPRLDLPDDDWSASAQGEVGAAPASAPGAVADGPEPWDDDDADADVTHDDLTHDFDDDGDDGDDDGDRPEDGRGAGGGGQIGDGGGRGGRDLAKAVPVGLALGVLAVVTIFFLGSAATAVLVTLVLAASAVEYFGVLRKVGWEAATLLGIAAIIALPLAVHWKGTIAWPIVGVLVVVAVFCWYLIGAGGPDPRVLEGAGATVLGVAWIGGLGAFGAALASSRDGRWLLFTAILATVVHDIAAFAIGRSFGRRPLSSASPNKTVEGVLGGMIAAFLVVVVVAGIAEKGPWTGLGAGLVLGLGVALAAPLGDLSQSLLKRDLGVKDMGTLLPGHGGVLDRFDSLLFVVPTVFWLTVTFGDVALR